MINSVKNPFVQMQSWFSMFEKKRTMHKKGLPLWSLKVTDTELGEMQSLLKPIFTAKEPTVVFNQYSCTGGSGKFDQIFTLYLATWVQRNFKGGKARWPVVLSSLNVKHDNRLNTAIYDSVRVGLKYWGIDLHATSNANQYFATLYCQGGFPRSGLVGLVGGPVSDYLDRVINFYGLFYHTSELEEIAERQLQGLPETLKQKPFATLACELISSLLMFRDQYHLYAVKDPVNTLNEKNPQWRDELPFLLCDEEAHELIGRVLNRAAAIIRREQHPVRIRRYLTGAMNDWNLVAETYINQTIHPEDLSNTLGKTHLPVYFDLYTQTDSGERARSASFNLKGQQNKRWQVLTKFTQFYDQDAASDIRYEIWSDGEKLGSDCYYRGDELNVDLPWVFSAEGDQFSFIGQGNVKSRHSSVFILTADDIKPGNENSIIEEVGRLKRFNRVLYRVQGKAHVCIRYGNFVISSCAEESQDYVCYLKGKKCQEAFSHKNAFIGIPDTFIRNDVNGSLKIDSNELYWQTIDDDSLVEITEDIKYGLGNIIWISNSEVKWQTSCALLPTEAKFEVINEERGEIELKAISLKNSDLGFIKEEKNWLRGVEFIEDLCLAEVQLPASMPDSFHPVLGWNHSQQNIITFEFDSMQTGVCLLDLNGRPFPIKTSALTLDDLFSSEVKIKLPLDTTHTYVNISAALISKKSIKTTLSEHIELDSTNVTIGCGKLAQLALMLYSQSDDLYDFVTFKFYSQFGELNARFPKVELFKHPVSNYKTSGKPLLKVQKSRTHKNRESIVLLSAPIWDLARSPVELKRTTNHFEDLLFELPESNDIGPWFIYAKNDRKIQPRAVFIQNDDIEQQNEGLSPLQLSIRDLSFDRNTGKFDYSAMDTGLDALMDCLHHEDWDTVQSFVLFLDLTPSATFHIFKRLIYRPKLIASLLIKQQELENFERVWSIAEDMPFEWLDISIDDWKCAAKLVLEKAVGPILPLQSHMNSEQFESLKRSVIQNALQLLSDKGDYFTAVSDIVMYELFDICPDWIGQEIFTPEGDSYPSLLGDFYAYKSELFANHEGHVLSHVQNKHNDEVLRESLKTTLSRDNLPPDLKGFVQHYSVEQEKANARMITLDLPVKIAFKNTAIFKQSYLDSSEHRLINFALNRLQQFDRMWIQQSMAVAIKAATIYKNNYIVE
jgi:hypothetical protein